MHTSSVLVVERNSEQERRDRRNTRYFVLLYGLQVLVQSALATSWLLQPDDFLYWLSPLPLTMAVFYAGALGSELRSRRIHRDMHDLRLVFAPEGVTYTSSAGTFSAPWSAVKRIQLPGHKNGTGGFAPRVRVHVPGWGGPVGRLGMFHRLTIHLTNTGVDADQVKRAVHQFSDGACTAVHV